jgi:hypothetical protein
MLADFGFRSPHFLRKYEFTPYFQYKIGKYQPDYFLYFPRQPYVQLYKNEIFSKLSEYSGFDVDHYLEFHYSAFDDKKEFLRFVRYETSERIKWLAARKPSAYRLCLETALTWANEKEAALPGIPPVSLPAVPASTSLLSLEEAFTTTIEPKMTELLQSLSGNIVLNNRHHTNRIIQVFILLKDMKAPGKTHQPLFKAFSATDIVALLRQFDEFKDLKINTIQGKVTAANDELDLNDPKIQNLSKALTGFFY